jgi:DNA-binding response OmpR family regulator
MSHPYLLLADEDEITRAFLADNLTADGYHVDTAQDRFRRRRPAETEQTRASCCSATGSGER